MEENIIKGSSWLSTPVEKNVGAKKFLQYCKHIRDKTTSTRNLVYEYFNANYSDIIHSKGINDNKFIEKHNIAPNNFK